MTPTFLGIADRSLYAKGQNRRTKEQSISNPLHNQVTKDLSIPSFALLGDVGLVYPQPFMYRYPKHNGSEAYSSTQHPYIHATQI
jgi:hypothetical protein